MPQETISVFILGARGAGKTSFLTGLSVLSQPNQESRFQLLPKDDRSAKLVTDMRQRVKLGEWPAGTSATTPLHMELSYGSTTFQLSVLDYPGEDLVQAMETMNHDEKENICENLVAADCILLLLDPTQDLISELNQEAESATERRQTALATAIGYSLSERLANHSQTKKPRIYPILTKADRVGGGKHLQTVARENTNLLKRLQEYARSHQKIEICAVSACGENPPQDGSFPTKPSPSGYGRLFQRIAEDCHKGRTRFRRWTIRCMITLLIIAAVAVFAALSWEQKSNVKIIDSSAVEEVLMISKPDPDLLDSRVEREIEYFERTLANPNASIDQLRTDRSELLSWREVRAHRYVEKLDELIQRFDTRVSDGLLSAAQRAFDDGDNQTALRISGEYLENFPTGIQRESIEALRNNVIGIQHRAYLTPIQSVSASSAPKVQKKIEKIEAYRQKFPDLGGRDVDAVDLAIKTARSLIQAPHVKLNFSSLKFNSKKREAGLYFYRNPPGQKQDDGQIIYEQVWEDFNQKTFSTSIELKQSQWADFEVCLWDYDLLDEIISSTRLNLYRDLIQFDGETRIKLKHTQNDKNVDGWFQSKVLIPNGKKLEALTQKQLKAYEDYIFPGSNW